MYRTNQNLEIKLRLREINRRSDELSAVSLKLAEMMAQLDRLRELDERIGISSDPNSPSDRNRNGDYFSHGFLDSSRRRIEFSRNVMDER